MNFDRVEEKLMIKIAEELNKTRVVPLAVEQIKAVVKAQSRAIKGCIEIGTPVRLGYAGKFQLKAKVLLQQAEDRRRFNGVVDRLGILENDKLKQKAIKAKAANLTRIEGKLQHTFIIEESNKLDFMAELNKSRAITNKRTSK